MTMAFCLLGGILLAWAFGRNNFGNVFGSAVGTGILSFKWAVFLTTLFLLLGAVFGSAGTSKTMLELAHFTSLSQACAFSLAIALIMIFLTKWGIPASVAQLSIGGLVGWHLAFQHPVAWGQVRTIVLGWGYSPVIACLIAFFVFKGTRFYLLCHPVPILHRDLYVRFLWGIVGSFSAYSLGANNLSVLIVPYQQTLSLSFLPLFFSLVVGMGCLMASHRVIRMLSSRLFPLSSVESLIVGFSGALTLLLFSFQNRFLPALPISIGAALIGAIVGVSLAKGGYGLKIKTLCALIASWFWAPLFSGLLCFIFAFIIRAGG